MSTTVKKRNGENEDYQPGKIIAAMQKAFDSDGTSISAEGLQDILERVEALLASQEQPQVEEIQDCVEQALMESGHYRVAKRYILYRERRAQLRVSRLHLTESLHIPKIESCLTDIQRDFPEKGYDLSRLDAKYESFKKENMTPGEELNALIKAAVELTGNEDPRWEMIAARLLYHQLSLNLRREEKKRGINDFYDKIKYLVDEGLYGAYILEHYSRDEILRCAQFIKEDRNQIYTYAGLDLLLSRYVIRDRHHTPLESPQEMYLGIALHLAMKEESGRIEWVRRFYDMLSLQKVTMATPTLSNARKPYHQLSSCFVDTVPDSLDGIYHSIDSFAKVSKFGGGMGMYFGKVRATGGAIRGFEGAAGGVIRWIKLVNDTAVAVDQLGMRQGAVAVYLDAWHKDLPEFLQIRTNNGDDRLKAHDVFPAVCYPDLFWKMVQEDINQSWYLLDPHDVLTVKGYALEDYWGEEWEARYQDCVQDNRILKREIKLKELVRLILKSVVETGAPFAFYRDTVNRLNANPEGGVIYCSNLCTEIAQNMSPAELQSCSVETRDGETVVVTTHKPGDFVVCNLASLNLGRIDVENESEIQDIVACAMRALDNVIDLNYYPIPYAEITNKKYRSVGLGVSGYHHMLATRKIGWESEEHLEFVDKVFERISYAAIKASSDNAREKGAYPKFHGSEWENGEFFRKRGYTSEKWRALASKVARDGMRNAYLIAIAPTSSTSILAGTTAGLDPIMHRFFLEEKKGAMLPRVAPDLSMDTYWYYKSTHTIDQAWTIRAAGIRQRHIDQAQSVNLYITNEFSLRQVLNLYLMAWKEGMKTIYYVRSKSLEVGDCESCSA
ncbi:MAG: ribonucleoside-diphosphate reductase subunit alpha [Ottowia sp.]|nr:ribonucleoside-diphosphate reductase subunit alpha [Ottowia sp.]